MAPRAARRSPTRFRLRVLAAKLGKRSRRRKLSPVIGPESSGRRQSDGAGVPTAPDGDCDGDGVKNGVDADDDNDLLADAARARARARSVRRRHRRRRRRGRLRVPVRGRPQQRRLPERRTSRSRIPGKTPYPNPLFKRRGRRLRRRRACTLREEYALWKYTYEVNHTRDAHADAAVATPTARSTRSPSYAGGNGVPPPTLTQPAALPTPPQDASAPGPTTHGLRQRSRLSSSRGTHDAAGPHLYDMDRDGDVRDVDLDDGTSARAERDLLGPRRRRLRLRRRARRGRRRPHQLRRDHGPLSRAAAGAAATATEGAVPDQVRRHQAVRRRQRRRRHPRRRRRPGLRRRARTSWSSAGSRCRTWTIARPASTAASTPRC